MRLSLTRSGGSSRRPVGVLPANFSIFGRKKSHQFLIMSKNLLQNLCSSCCDCWCRIFRLGAVHHVLLVLEFREKADHGFFNNICLPVSSFLDGQLSSPYDFLMDFARRVLGRHPCFLGQREMIPGLDGLSVFSCLVKNAVCLGYLLGVRIGTVFHVPVLKKVFNLVGNFVNWIDRAITHICRFFFKIVQMTW